MTTIAEIISAATTEGTWINGGFEAVVLNAQPRKGKVPSKADLCHPKNHAIKVRGALFSGSFLDLQGSLVKFAGQGMKAKLYNSEVDVSIGDKATLLVIGDAPVAEGASTPPAQSAASGGTKTQAPVGTPPPAKEKPAEDPTPAFHRGMKKIALLYIHAWQYATDANLKLHSKMTPEQFQAAVSTFLITADRNGVLRNPIPPPREPDGVGFRSYVPPKVQVDPAIAEEEARKAKEEAAAKAAEAARIAAEQHEAEAAAERARKAQDLEEDVPF